MKCCNAYESESMRLIMGDTLRPGGFSLTEKALQFCKISEKDAVLDLGCGWGATVDYLYKSHHVRAVGIDPSEKLLEVSKSEYEHLDLILGRGENLPFEDKSFNCVFAECTLSLMDDLNSCINEVFRVLKEHGWFVITDVYAKRPEAISELTEFTFNSCMRGLHNLELLKENLRQTGFSIEIAEDCSHLLRELLVKIGFRYGSIGAFWNIVTEDCDQGCRFQEALKHCKPGYFMLVARKGGA